MISCFRTSFSMKHPKLDDDFFDTDNEPSPSSENEPGSSSVGEPSPSSAYECKTVVPSLQNKADDRSGLAALSVSLRLAELRMNDAKNVHTLKVLQPLHKGRYCVDIFAVAQDTTLGFIMPDISTKSHTCVEVDRDSYEMCALVIKKPGEERVQINCSRCLNTGVYVGGGIFDDEDRFIISLIRSEEMPSTVSANPKNRLVGKAHCCLYCKKFYVEMTKHLSRVHNNEVKVQEALKKDKNSSERNALFRNLRVQGDYEHNRNALPHDKVPIRRSNTSDVTNYVTCSICLYLISKRNYPRHERLCSGREPNHKRVTKLAMEKELASRLSLQEKVPVRLAKQETYLQRLLMPIRVDFILHQISSDRTIQLLAQWYALNHRGKPLALRNDRQILRRIARLLGEIKDLDSSIVEFEDVVINGDYNIILDGIFEMCGADENTGVMATPSLALAMRSAIWRLLSVAKSDHLLHDKTQDSEIVKKYDCFIQLHNDYYGVYIKRAAGRTRLERRTRKAHDLPSPQDVKAFSTLIWNTAREAYESLKQNGFKYRTWLQLVKAEVCKVILFNRRRVSEVASMSLDLYRARTTLDKHTRDTLSIHEGAIADNYVTMKIIGKREHILHVLLDKEQCQHLDLVVSYRKEAQVPDGNHYLFGVPDNALYVDVSSALREFSVKCGAERPLLLRSTYLRKQVATMSQLLNLNDNQIGQISKLMGHNQKVHEQVYRYDENLFRLTRWAKFLTIMTKDDLYKIKDKTFDELVTMVDGLPDPNPVDDYARLDHITIDEIINSNRRRLSSAGCHDTVIFDCGELGRSCKKEPMEPNSDGDEGLPASTQQKDNSRETLIAATIDDDENSVDDPDFSRGTSHDECLLLRSNPRKFTAKSRARASVRHYGLLKYKLRASPYKSLPTNKPVTCSLDMSPVQHVLKRRPFSAEEKSYMQFIFRDNLRTGDLPLLDTCRDIVMKKRDVFRNRRGCDLYNWVQYNRKKSAERRRPRADK